jgi:hypothetical protein
MEIPKCVTAKFLRDNPNVVFVFGDNLVRRGRGGAAKLRNEPNTYGFVTKKYPNNEDESFFRPAEYWPVFVGELSMLHREILLNPHKTYLISKLGGGLANRYEIREDVIKPGLEVLRGLKNVVIM